MITIIIPDLSKDAGYWPHHDVEGFIPPSPRGKDHYRGGKQDQDEDPAGGTDRGLRKGPAHQARSLQVPLSPVRGRG